MKKIFILFVALSLLAVGCGKTIVGQDPPVNVSSHPAFHIYSPDGRNVDPSALKNNGNGQFLYAYDDPGQWSVLINEKPSSDPGEKVYTIPTQTDINDWKKSGVDISKVSVNGSDAYVWQGLPGDPYYSTSTTSSLDITIKGIDISILSLKPLDTNTLMDIAQSLK